MSVRRRLIMYLVILVTTAIDPQHVDAGQTALFRTTPVFDVGQGPTAIVSCDLNEDGIKDVVTVNQTFNDIAVLLSDGTGGFQPQVRFGVGLSPRDLTCIDLNGDEHLDVVTVNNSNHTASILRGNGDGTFMVGALSVNVLSSPLSLAVGFMDDDEFPDIAVGNSGQVRIYLVPVARPAIGCARRPKPRES